MTLRVKLVYIWKYYPEIYETLKLVVPKLVEDPEHPSKEDLDQYNFWIDAIDEDEAQPLYHLV